MKNYFGRKTVRSTIAISIYIFVGIIAGYYYFSSLPIRETDTITKVYYIHNNPCESCREYLHFLQKLQSQVSDEISSSYYQVQELNILLESSQETYHKLMEELDISVQDRITPILVVGNQYTTGSTNIGTNMKDMLISEVRRRENSLQKSSEKGRKGRIDDQPETKMETDDTLLPQVELNQDDSYVLYFSTTSCESCEKATDVIWSLPEQLQVIQDGEKISSRLVVEEKNIVDASNLALYQQLLTEFHVPEEERVVPMIFFQGGYLSGEEAIQNELESILLKGEGLDFNRAISASTNKPEGYAFEDLPKIIATGLVSGLNPCSFSMLFLLLSLIAAKKSSVLKLGLIYIASKLIAYTAIALSIYSILNILNSRLLVSLQDIIRVILIIAALLLGIINFIDFISAKRAQYGKILLKLPTKLRNADRNIIQKLINDNKKPLWISVFIIGFIISAGEFLCTGQVYLATLLTMNYMDPVKGVFSNFLILIYVLAMIIPSFCVVFLVYRGKRLLIISDFIVRHTDAIKFINMVMFFVIGIILLCYHR